MASLGDDPKEKQERGELCNFDQALEGLERLLTPPTGGPKEYPALPIYSAVSQLKLLFRQGSRALLLKKGGQSAEALEDIFEKVVRANDESLDPLARLRRLVQDSMVPAWERSAYLGRPHLESPAPVNSLLESVAGDLVKTRPAKAKLFIVHGHRLALVKAVSKALSLQKGIEIEILSRLSHRGRTIIEKFEQTARKSNVAIVILTGDDLGSPTKAPRKGKRRYQRRARQNVVFEGGFFTGRLGREAVIFLYEKGVDLPSDLVGVGYIPLDAKSKWKAKLAAEVADALLPRVEGARGARAATAAPKKST